MSSQAQLVLRVSVAWWLRPYLTALCFVAHISGRQPDMDKLTKVFRRAVKLHIDWMG